MPHSTLTASGPALVATQADPVFETVCVLLEPYNRKGAHLLRDTEISADMEVDSITVFDVIMEIEDAYEISFPMEAIADLKTIGHLVDAIRRLAN